MISISQISNWYLNHSETRLKGRYIYSKHVNPLISEFEKKGDVEVIGISEKGENIHLLKFGRGPKNVLAWSQMHGNESTTTKAIFDFLKFLTQENQFEGEINAFKNQFTFYVVPILNPDGAKIYTRENANGIDLNRDAQNLSQSESKALKAIFDKLMPDVCFNLHDQRTIYSLKGNMPATLSFLAPAADKSRSLTKSRKESMLSIARINHVLQTIIPNQIGRYDDSFNINCVGDSFQAKGAPTILFEAGHFPNDYQREKTREFIFYALLSFFEILDADKHTFTLKDYQRIPENEKNFRDVVLRNVSLNNEIVDIFIQFQEKLQNDKIVFVPTIDKISKNSRIAGHKEIDIQENEILINSHENVFVNEEISIILFKKTKKPIII